jgi:hypothetical protein
MGFDGQAGPIVLQGAVIGVDVTVELEAPFALACLAVP